MFIYYVHEEKSYTFIQFVVHSGVNIWSLWIDSFINKYSNILASALALRSTQIMKRLANRLLCLGHKAYSLFFFLDVQTWYLSVSLALLLLRTTKNNSVKCPVLPAGGLCSAISYNK